MWFVCFGLFAVSSAFPLGGGNELENYRVQLVRYGVLPRQRHSICLPSPFLGQVCLPSAFQFFMPLRTLETGHRRCLSIPIMRAYAVKVCPPENSEESFKEVGTETENVPDKEDKNVESENKISRDLKEIEVGGEDNSSEPPSIDKNAQDENISITSNLV